MYKNRFKDPMNEKNSKITRKRQNTKKITKKKGKNRK